MSLLASANLTSLVTASPLVVDPQADVIHIAGVDAVASLTALSWLVSCQLLDGYPAVLYHCPAWAGRGWEFLRADHSSPVLVAYAFPDLIQAQDEYRDSLAQQILGRLVNSQKTAIATLGTWEPRSPVEALLLLELKRRHGDGAGAGRPVEDQTAGTGARAPGRAD